MNSERHAAWVGGSVMLAVALPTVILHATEPSPSAINNLTSIALWGMVLVVLARSVSWAPLRMPPVGWALLLLMLATVAGPFAHGTPWSVAANSFGGVLAALLVLLAATRVAPQDRPKWFEALAVGVLLAAILNAGVSWLQVFAPTLTGNLSLAAPTNVVGRSTGNLRQPNHLATLLVWAGVTAVYLTEAGRWRGWHRSWFLPVCILVLVLTLVLSASRTGMLGVLGLACWGAVDRQLKRRTRWVLMASPLVYGVGWLVLGWLAEYAGFALIAQTRLAQQGMGSGERLQIWRNALELLMQHPWVGVGWGEFNFAWALTPMTDRPHGVVSHVHNLPLHLAVELGIPLALLVLGLVGWTCWQVMCATKPSDAQGMEKLSSLATRCTLGLVSMAGLHSMLEFPLWYAYFLLPLVFSIGLVLPLQQKKGGGQTIQGDDASVAGYAQALLGLGLLLGALIAMMDFIRVAELYQPSETPLERRITIAQQHFFFRQHADYAFAAMANNQEALDAAKRASHEIVGPSLLLAWALSLHATGDDDKARYVVARLREFQDERTNKWFAECDKPLPANGPRPFQCDPPQRNYSLEELR